MWKTYGKTYAQLLATLVMAGIVTYRQVAGDGVTASEWVMVIIALFGVFTVWGAANITGFEKAKTLMGAVALILNLLVSMIIGGLTSDEMLLLVVQFLGALGVAGAKAPLQVVSRTVTR
jgi:FtsH-binding integral membrane protein